jgi:hypothetical protein
VKAFYFLTIAFMASQTVSAQTAPSQKPISNGTTAVTSSLMPVAPIVQATLPGSPVGPRSGPAVLSEQPFTVARNPMLPPVVVPNAVPAADGVSLLPVERNKRYTAHEKAAQTGQAAMGMGPQVGGAPNFPGPGLQPFAPDMGVAPADDPIKANGKRIGSLNGNPIFKLEDAYYFEKTVKNKTK